MLQNNVFYRSEFNFFLFFHSLSGGELFERITAEGYSMSEAEVINYMRQICEAVKHMHEKNIIHLGESIIAWPVTFDLTFTSNVL